MTLFSEPEHNGAGGFDAPERRLLGKIIGGSLSHGLDMRLEPHISLESVKVGQYVTVDGEQTRFFCVVSDLRLEATDAALASSPPDLSNPLVAEVLRGTGTYGVVHLAPTLTYGASGAQPVRTVPSHYAQAYEATQEELEKSLAQRMRNTSGLAVPWTWRTPSSGWSCPSWWSAAAASLARAAPARPISLVYSWPVSFRSGRRAANL